MSVINSRNVGRRIARGRAGLSFLDHRSPGREPISGLQDTALRRTVLLPATSRRIRDIDHGLATRVPGKKNAATARGFTIFRGTIVYHESELEHRTSLRLQARSDVRQIHSQYPVMRYLDADGVLREHTVDYFVEYEDGFRQGCLVKLEKKRTQMELLMTQLEAGRNPAVLDGLVLLTENFGSHAAAQNARMVLWSRDYHDQSDVDELLEIVRHLRSYCRFGTLLKDCVSVPRRRVAIWRLIDAGVLFSPTGERISELTWLGYSPKGGPTGLLGPVEPGKP